MLSPTACRAAALGLGVIRKKTHHKLPSTQGVTQSGLVIIQIDLFLRVFAGKRLQHPPRGSDHKFRHLGGVWSTAAAHSEQSLALQGSATL